MGILAVVNQKGGVGKTTTAVNLTAALAAAGRRVLLCDFDPQANATSGLGGRKSGIPSVYEVLTGACDAQTAIVHTPYGDLLPSSAALSGAAVELVGVENREFLLRDALNTVKDRYDTIFSNDAIVEAIKADFPEQNIYSSTSYPIISGDMFVEDKDVARHICDFGYPLSDYVDCGIDMESTAIAQTCYRANIPFGSIRIVSDAPCRAEWLEQYKYEDFWLKAPDTLHKILKSVIDHCTHIMSNI